MKVINLESKLQARLLRVWRAKPFNESIYMDCPAIFINFLPKMYEIRDY